MLSVKLRVAGMHCEGCAKTIKTLLDKEPGVQTSDVSYDDGCAQVLYDPGTTSEDRLVGVIEQAGFEIRGREP